MEEAADPGALIVTLRTRDGFGVSFSMPRGKAESLGFSLAAGASRPCVATTH